MEEGKSYSEENSSTVKETKEPVDDYNKIKSIAHEEISSERSKDKEEADSKRGRRSIVFKSTYSNHPIMKLKLGDKETTPSSSCHQMVPKIECMLETNGHIPPEQEASNNTIKLSIEEEIKEPARKERHADWFESENELDPIATISEFTNDSQKQNAPSEPPLVEFIDQAVEKCLQVMIDKVVCEHETEVGILLSLQALHQSKEQTQSKKPMNTVKSQLLYRFLQSNLDIKEGSSSQEVPGILLEMKPELSSATKNPLIEGEQRKKVQKDYRILYSVLEEIERMNDYYKNNAIKLTSRAKAIHRLALHMYENMEVLESVPSCYIMVINNGEPCGELNVLAHCSEIYKYLIDLYIKTGEFLNEFNILRMNFHEASIIFVSTEFEKVIGCRQKGALEEALEMSRCFYKTFFRYEKFDLQFESIKEAHQSLLIQVDQFSTYMEMLSK